MVEVGESVVAEKGLYDTGIKNAVDGISDALLAVKDQVNRSGNHSSLESSLVNLKTVLLGRKKLYEIASYAVSTRVDPVSWISAADNSSKVANQLEAVRIAQSWDKLNGEYSAKTHDNATVASVAVILGLKLPALSDRYIDLAEAVDMWIFKLKVAKEVLSPEGLSYGQDFIRYRDFGDDMKDYFKLSYLTTPRGEVVYRLAKDLLKLPGVLSYAPTTTTTSTTTTRTPARVFAEWPSLFELLFG